MIHYCTYADHNFLPRAIALVDSLKRGDQEFTLWFLCLSPECHEILQKLNDDRIRPLALEELEAKDDELLLVKPQRSRSEYIFTLTAAWMMFLFDTQAEIELLTYLDSDLYFFNSPSAIFEEMGAASVGIIEHRHSRPSELYDQYGRFNVGWVSIRRDEVGLSCARNWRAQCLEWCHDRAEDGKFADQKYLDVWPNNFPGVHIITHPGANLAPWNVERHRLSRSGNSVIADGRPVIFYHFTNMWRCRPNYIWTGLGDYLIEASVKTLSGKLLYRPYIKAVMAATCRLRSAEFSGAAFNYSRHSVTALDALNVKKTSFRKWIQLYWKFNSERSRGDILFCRQ